MGLGIIETRLLGIIFIVWPLDRHSGPACDSRVETGCEFLTPVGPRDMGVVVGVVAGLENGKMHVYCSAST